MKLRLLIFFCLVTVLTGCNSVQSYNPPPTYANTKEILSSVTQEQLYTQWTEYRQKDKQFILNLVKQNDKKNVAVKQWIELYKLYCNWKEKGGLVHEKSGIVIYGPVASGWINEILHSMAVREAIITGAETSDFFQEDMLPDWMKKKYTWLDFKVFNNNNYLWAGLPKGNDRIVQSDIQVSEQIRDYLDQSSYPFENGIFDGTEIYAVSADGFYSDTFYGNKGPKAKATGVTPLVGYDPNNGIAHGGVAVKILVSWPSGLKIIGHELGHAWEHQHYHSAGGLVDIIKTYLGHRMPAVPDSLPNNVLDDQALLGIGVEGTDYFNAPWEVMAEDFLRLYFPKTEQEWKFGFEDIYSSETASNMAVQAKLKEFFSISTGETYALEPFPRVTKGDNITIKGVGIPGSEIHVQGAELVLLTEEKIKELQNKLSEIEVYMDARGEDITYYWVLDKTDVYTARVNKDGTFAVNVSIPKKMFDKYYYILISPEKDFSRETKKIKVFNCEID